MGLRFRKSIKIAPGVKLNIGKKSIGLSAGAKGAHVSINSKGRVTKSIGIPGTGVSYVSSSKIGKSKKSVSSNTAKASYAASAENEQSSATSNVSSEPKEKKGEKHILRWFGYLLIVFVATGIHENLCYPGMLLAGLLHLYHIRSSVFEDKKRKRSTVLTCCFLVFAAFGCFVTISELAPL